MFSERMNNKGNHHSGNNDNSWGGNNVRKSFDSYNRGGNYQHDGNTNKLEQRMHSLRLDNGGSKNESAGPKKMTWASIASQPAKPTVTTITSATKKKGSGPPPPIILGKHDLDDPAWDAPKNVVPPSPPIIAAPQPEVNAKQSSLEESPAWPTLDKAEQLQNQNSTERNASTAASAHQQQQSRDQHQPQHGRDGHQGGYQSGYQRSNYGNNNGNGHYRDNRDSYQHGNRDRDYNGGGGYNNSNGNGGYSQDRQYNNSGYNGNGRGGGGGHYNSYNDFAKPYHQHPHQMPSAPPSQGNHRSDGGSGAPITRGNPPARHAAAAPSPPASVIQRKPAPEPEQPAAVAAAAKVEVVANLLQEHLYNPSELDLSRVDNARFFVIKSYSEDDIHRSIKYEIWCSTEHGNKRLDQAFHEREKEGGVVYLLFSVNSSGHFCGVAQMITPVDYSSNSSVWAQDKWKGSFHVKWIYVKDVPNPQLRHIRLENNENKPVTNSRDTQEVPNHHGIQMMKIIHAFKHTTSIFDDFTHYEKRQEEEGHHRKYESEDDAPHQGGNGRQFDNDRSYNDRGDRDFNGSQGSGGFDRGGSFNSRNGDRNGGGGGYNKYGNSGYNNDFKSFNGRGGFHKRNDFRSNDRNDQPESRGFYRNKPDYQDQDDDFGGPRSDRGGDRGGYRPPHFQDRGSFVRGGNRGNGGFRDRMD